MDSFFISGRKYPLTCSVFKKGRPICGNNYRDLILAAGRRMLWQNPFNEEDEPSVSIAESSIEEKSQRSINERRNKKIKNRNNNNDEEEYDRFAHENLPDYLPSENSKDSEMFNKILKYQNKQKAKGYDDAHNRPSDFHALPKNNKKITEKRESDVNSSYEGEKPKKKKTSKDTTDKMKKLNEQNLSIVDESSSSNKEHQSDKNHETKPTTKKHTKENRKNKNTIQNEDNQLNKNVNETKECDKKSQSEKNGKTINGINDDEILSEELAAENSAVKNEKSDFQERSVRFEKSDLISEKHLTEDSESLSLSELSAQSFSHGLSAFSFSELSASVQQRELDGLLEKMNIDPDLISTTMIEGVLDLTSQDSKISEVLQKIKLNTGNLDDVVGRDVPLTVDIPQARILKRYRFGPDEPDPTSTKEDYPKEISEDGLMHRNRHSRFLDPPSDDELEKRAEERRKKREEELASLPPRRKHELAHTTRSQRREAAQLRSKLKASNKNNLNNNYEDLGSVQEISEL